MLKEFCELGTSEPDGYRQQYAQTYLIRSEAPYLSIMIQPTSLSRYISGKSALNIPHKEYLGGDWHFSEAFVRPTARIHYAGDGEGTFINTNAWLGSVGVKDCREELFNAGLDLPPAPVFAALPPRAVLDLILKHFSKGIPQSHLPVADYFYDAPDIEKLLEFVEFSRSRIPRDAFAYIERHISTATLV